MFRKRSAFSVFQKLTLFILLYRSVLRKNTLMLQRTKFPVGKAIVSPQYYTELPRHVQFCMSTAKCSNRSLNVLYECSQSEKLIRIQSFYNFCTSLSVLPTGQCVCCLDRVQFCSHSKIQGRTPHSSKTNHSKSCEEIIVFVMNGSFYTVVVVLYNYLYTSLLSPHL